MIHRLALAIMGLSLAGVPAQAACWSDLQANSAKLSDMQMMIAVMAQRCEAAGHSVRGDYDAYLTATRRTMAIVNQRMKSRFWTLYGSEEGQRRLDAYALRLADGYVRVAAVAENCDQVAALAREAAANGESPSSLAVVAARNDFTPAMPGGRCSTLMAAATAQRAAAP